MVKKPLYTGLLKRIKNMLPGPGHIAVTLKLAGTFTINVTANAGISLDDIEKSVFDAFSLFEKEGISLADLERVKAGLETQYYNRISSVLGKAFQLGDYNEYKGDASYIEKEIDKYRAVSREDVIRVYNKYIKGKPYVATSFVPKGQLKLALANSDKG
jgi:zinc protease